MSRKQPSTGTGAEVAPAEIDATVVAFPAPAAPELATDSAAISTSDDRFEHIPTKVLSESKTNPRRNFDDQAMADLTENIRMHGVLEPLVVRPLTIDGANPAYEIVAGARRFRAASAAGLDTVPAIIKRNLTDQQVIEMQLIENLHRADLHPLEEANGYRQLIDDMSYDVPTIAAKITKSASYVYQRLKLAALVPEAQQALCADQFSTGHAILIARLQPADQQRCLAAINQGYVTSVRELSRWIEQQVHLDLGAAPFPSDDAALVPEAGACTACPKRVGGNPALFFEQLVAELIERLVEWAKARRTNRRRKP